jgi:H+/gluconate symporter-like permease
MRVFSTGGIAGLIMLGIGALWLTRRADRAGRAGEGYGDHPLDQLDVSPTAHDEPSLLVAVTPRAIVLLVNVVATWWVIPAMDLAYLAEPKFGRTSVNDVRGIWALVASLGLAIITAIVLHWPRWSDLKGSVNQGTMSSLLPIFNTASEIGYGAVIASLAAFAVVQAALVGISSNLLGAAAGISPQLLHRVAAIASGGLDSLPHNGAVITILGICRLSHRESYFDIFMVTVVGPLLALAGVLVVGSTVGAF